METMIIDLCMFVGGVLAALAIAAMCGLGLVVWYAGRGEPLHHK